MITTRHFTRWRIRIILKPQHGSAWFLHAVLRSPCCIHDFPKRFLGYLHTAIALTATSYFSYSCVYMDEYQILTYFIQHGYHLPYKLVAGVPGPSVLSSAMHQYNSNIRQLHRKEPLHGRTEIYWSHSAANLGHWITRNYYKTYHRHKFSWF